jgi:hypothetical protein
MKAVEGVSAPIIAVSESELSQLLWLFYSAAQVCIDKSVGFKLIRSVISSNLFLI